MKLLLGIIVILGLCAAIQADEGIGISMPFHYVGCYRDGNPRALPKIIGNGLTTKQCVNRARKRGYKFVGRQWKSETCFAGNNYHYRTYGPANEVGHRTWQSYTCHKDKCGFWIGGGMTNAVYRIDGKKERKLQAHLHYIGCYLDRHRRAIPKLLGSHLTLKQCSRVARHHGYRYIGWQSSSRQCFAGNGKSYRKYGGGNEVNHTTWAHRTCHRRNGRWIGGSWTNAVYRVDGRRESKLKAHLYYVGCFYDPGHKSLRKLLGNHLTAKQCSRLAQHKGYKYIGRQWSVRHCFAGNNKNYDRFGEGENVKNKTWKRGHCFKHNGFMIGGGWTSAIYRVDGKKEVRLKNVAYRKPCRMYPSRFQDKPEFGCARAFDNKKNTIAHTKRGYAPWIRVNLQGLYHISRIVIVNRQDCCQNRSNWWRLEVLNGTRRAWTKQGRHMGSMRLINLPKNVKGSKVSLTVKRGQIDWLNIAEIKVYGKRIGNAPRERRKYYYWQRWWCAKYHIHHNCHRYCWRRGWGRRRCRRVCKSKRSYCKKRKLKMIKVYVDVHPSQRYWTVYRHQCMRKRRVKKCETQCIRRAWGRRKCGTVCRWHTTATCASYRTQKLRSITTTNYFYYHY